jgi:[CysO sulfur-carrier protein]-S-L-cysteine hydrolase
MPASSYLKGIGLNLSLNYGTMTEDILRQIFDHARAEYPNECCGAVWRVAGSAAVQAARQQDAGGTGRWEVMRCTNIQNKLHAQDPQRYPRDARTAYTIHPKELLAINRRAEEPGQHLAILYHSHPDHDAYFSSEDVYFAAPFGEPAYPDTAYMVISVRQGEVRDHKCFVWDESRVRYVEGDCLDPRI